MQALRTAVKQTAPVMRRQFSGHSAEEAWASTKQWKQASKGAAVAVAGLLTINGIMIMSADHHHHHPPAYSYLRVRSKPFPWECDCGPFEDACWDKCKAAKAASS